VYLWLPRSILPGSGEHHRLPKYMGRCLENLAVRGGMLWVGQTLTRWSGGESLIVLYLFCIMATGPHAWASPRRRRHGPSTEDDGGDGNAGSKLQGCHTMLSLLCAQQLVKQLSASSLSTFAGGCVLATGVAVVGGLSCRVASTEHVFADVCAFGVSLLSTQQMEQWLEGSSAIEACCTYACVFALLECFRSGAAVELWASMFVVVAQGGALELNLEVGEAESLLVLW
jgi:hypothetical protein